MVPPYGISAIYIIIGIINKSKSEIKNITSASVVCDDCQQHNPTFEDFSILCRCNNEVQCKLFEAFAIKHMHPIS